MSPSPPASCAGSVDTCWSPGQPDGDCPNFGLCCFDGCSNTCPGGDACSNIAINNNYKFELSCLVISHTSSCPSYLSLKTDSIKSTNDNADCCPRVGVTRVMTVGPARRCNEARITHLLAVNLLNYLQRPAHYCLFIVEIRPLDLVTNTTSWILWIFRYLNISAVHD